jgi:hypothetical protein
MKTKKQIELSPTATARAAVPLLAVATAVIPVMAFAASQEPPPPKTPTLSAPSTSIFRNRRSLTSTNACWRRGGPTRKRLGPIPGRAVSEASSTC